MKRAALVVLILIIAAFSTAIGHQFGYQKGQTVVAAKKPKAMTAPARETSVDAPSADPIQFSPSEPKPGPAVAAAPAAAAGPAASSTPEMESWGTITLGEGDLEGFRFLRGNGGDPEATGDRARYPGIGILETECGITEGQVLRMFEWLKIRDEAYKQLSQIKDPAVHAAQGQWTKDYYESLFRNEMTPEQQKKYDELKKEGAFSFRGPPEFVK